MVLLTPTIYCLQASKEVIEPNDAAVWWANKELHREKNLCDYVGKNDKTKAIVKLQKVFLFVFDIHSSLF